MSGYCRIARRAVSGMACARWHPAEGVPGDDNGAGTLAGHPHEHVYAQAISTHQKNKLTRLNDCQKWVAPGTVCTAAATVAGDAAAAGTVPAPRRSSAVNAHLVRTEISILRSGRPSSRASQAVGHAGGRFKGFWTAKLLTRLSKQPMPQFAADRTRLNASRVQLHAAGRQLAQHDSRQGKAAQTCLKLRFSEWHDGN